jgi:hypothetical protein
MQDRLLRPKIQPALEVTVNCHTALMYLRQPQKTRSIWIDAICIDQSNLQERNQQVRIMGDIYAAASSVVTFLGESDRQSRLLFQYLTLVDALRRFGISESNTPMPGSSNITNLANLFRRPWFSRIWVIQEAYSAANLVFMCGAQFATLSAIRFCLYNGAMNTSVVYDHPLALRVAQNYQWIWMDGCSTSVQKLVIFLAGTGRCSASDPRDRVLALIPLVGPESHNLKEIVDYTKSTEEIFEGFSLTLIDDIGLLMAVLCRHPHSRDMPSWMIDFNVNTTWNHLYNTSFLFPFLQNWLRQEFDVVQSSNACNSSSRCLVVKGFRYGQVDELGPTMNLQADGQEAREPLMNEIYATMDAMLDGETPLYWPIRIVEGYFAPLVS